MKRLFNGILDVIKIVAMFIYALICSIILWWPILAIGLIVVFALSFLSTIAAIVLVSIIGLLFLMVFLIKMFDKKY